MTMTFYFWGDVLKLVRLLTVMQVDRGHTDQHMVTMLPIRSPTIYFSNNTLCTRVLYLSILSVLFIILILDMAKYKE